MRIFHNYILAAALIAVTALVASTSAQAEILKSGLTYFIGSDVVVIPVPASLPTPGIFIAHNLDPKRKFTPQELNLDFSRESVASVFLRYKDGKFTSLALPSATEGSANEIRIAGDFSLKVGPTATISVSSANSPWYLSVSVFSPGKAPEIIGFLGLSSIVRARGPEPVSLLQANQFSSSSSLIPYLLAFDRVLLNEKPVTGKVGVPLTDERLNPCFQQDAHILDEAYYDKFREVTLREKLKIMRISRATLKPEDLVILSSSSNVQTVFDTRGNRFGLIRHETKMESGEVCSFTELRNLMN